MEQIVHRPHALSIYVPHTMPRPSPLPPAHLHLSDLAAEMESEGVKSAVASAQKTGAGQN